ncbi:MAG TPA: hypothetical protein ENN80_11670, partial [Candidatus Hydrogenedentes bacterium]|nr:hypothetical protein [Candidatus Hydrogenedentota bacterium]
MIEETAYLRFDKLEAQRVLLGGWHDPRGRVLTYDAPDGSGFRQLVGASSIESELELCVLDPRPLALHLRMRQHNLKNLEPQTVGVVWNDTWLGTCEFEARDGWSLKDFHFDVPETAQCCGVNTVTFLSRFAISKEQLAGERNQGRPHAFALASLGLADLGASQREEAPSAPVEFRSGVIVQRGRTRLHIPVALPDAQGLALRLDVVDLPPNARATLDVRWDAVPEPK